MLFYSESLPILTNPEFTLGLFNPHYAPNQNLYNKLASLIECAEVINSFFNDCLTSDNVDLPHTADLSSSNRTIRDH